MRNTKNKTPRYTCRPFNEAREFARSLKLNGQAEWRKWAKTDERPEDIPANAYSIYMGQGWISWGDWLGTRKNRRLEYRSYEEAREFVRKLGLKSQKEWKIWAKSDQRPDDIPLTPHSVYQNRGWFGIEDWLGTGQPPKRNRQFRSFIEAREFAQSLRLQGQTDWQKWIKSGKRPSDIPSNPARVYQDSGWKNWGDWLGTHPHRNRKGGHLPFEDARKYAQSMGFKSRVEWQGWVKSGKKPENIPSAPDRAYKEKGWNSWGDWLGTGRVAPQNMTFRPFADARDFVRQLKLMNVADWDNWTKSANRPDDIPAGPARVYKNSGWENWGDWLGTKNRIGEYRPFNDARQFVRKIGLKSKEEWSNWAKSDLRPVDIPSSPSNTYKNQGWINWGDWLGTNRVANQNRTYRDFENSREFVRSLQLKNQTEWIIWAKSEERPEDIPANPRSIYENSGWISMGDWIGVINRWDRPNILNFLYGMKPILPNLQPSELFALMRQNGMINSSKHSNHRENASFLKSIKDLCSSPNPESDFEALINEIERENELLDSEEPETEEPELIPGEEDDREELPALRSLEALKAVDALVEAGITSDEETIEFLIANRVSGLWQDVLNKDLATELEKLRQDSGGMYFNTIRERFFSQFDGAQKLDIPAGYDFRVKGQLAQPNLMQKLTAHRVLTERRLGNWSGVGAGKTLSAILASRVVDARLTIIVAFNSTVGPWAVRVQETFPDSAIFVKERGEIEVNPSRHTYLILNFETFQQPDSAEMVTKLVAEHKIDFVVLDEIQSVKQRTPKVTSKRRQVVAGLIAAAAGKNPDLCVLGMSATPVINNLFEAKALLELVKGVEFNDLQTFSSIANASAMHEKLILHGIRYRPLYNQTIETEFKEIPGNDYLSQLQKVRKGAILDLERILLEAKLDAITAALKKGTLVYCHYLTGLVEPLRQSIEKAGFTVGLFTGEDKSGLEPFKKGQIDVLIGSVPVGTGVDGLQYVCNRMVAVSLPWTSAEYEQLIGRLYRQGSVFDKVEVIIPQVVLEHNGDTWSWDKMRWHRIQYKKTLADAALDGVIPQGELASPETMLKKAREALQAWIERIEQDGIAIIEREKLRVPLPKETSHIIQRRFGDLSTMNARFNTAYSHTSHERLKENPEEWYLYHTLYREARKTWTEIPFEKIAKSLKKRPDWVIGDFGCGEAKLAEILPNKVYSFDHVAINEKVTAGDMSRTPLEDSALDVAIFSLSLMGLNYADYLKEACRTLKFGGFLKIAEPANRWAEKRQELLENITSAGFQLIGAVAESNQFIYIDAIKTAE